MQSCNCSDFHPRNAARGDAPISLWRCDKHGNMFDDGVPTEPQPLPITLTATQREILEFIHRRHAIGQPAGVEEVSEHFGYSMGSVRVQFSVLQSLNFIERA